MPTTTYPDQYTFKEYTTYTGQRISKPKYHLEVTHYGLNEYKVFTAPEISILENKVQVYVTKLDAKWVAVLEKQRLLAQKTAGEAQALQETTEAQDRRVAFEDILHSTLGIHDALDWQSLKDKSVFEEEHPAIGLRAELESILTPTKPETNDFVANLNLADLFLSARKKRKQDEAVQRYEQAVVAWGQACEEAEARRVRLRQAITNESAQWEGRQKLFLLKQKAANDQVDLLEKQYLEGVPAAVSEYCRQVLGASRYPESVRQEFEVEYTPTNKIVVVDYTLPTLEDMPTLKEVKFKKDEFVSTHLTSAQTQKLYDSTLYKMTLRTLHELFEADTAKMLDAVSFNGWVTATNPATGQAETNCILSLQVTKEEFLQVDLANVEAKVCFKRFKGVSSSNLSSLTAIRPILQISREDSRFVEHYAVAQDLDLSTNLAAMHWEDFEHLIREVFAKEFASGDGEVRVTQASRDGGVDAIAFDPDPIRGGKIVIQAKRYTNTVGVSAVRDLYGTVMNEGATKGVLVTTADYGPDAYAFAKDKPLSLLNGSNLLHLLERHGHQVKIDLQEAKKELRQAI